MRNKTAEPFLFSLPAFISCLNADVRIISFKKKQTLSEINFTQQQGGQQSLIYRTRQTAVLRLCPTSPLTASEK